MSAALWGVALGVLLFSSAAQAQSQDAAPFEAAISPDALLSLHGANTLPHLGLYTSVSLGYANDPAVARWESQREGRVVSRLIQHRIGGEVALALGLFSRLELAAALPIYFRQLRDNYRPGGDGPDESGPGDLRLSLKGHIWRVAGLGIAAVAEISLPTGDRDDLMGEGVATFSPRLVVDYRHPIGLHVAANVAYKLRGKRELEDMAMDDELFVGLGVEQRLGVGGFSAGAELDLSLGLGTLDSDESAVSLRRSPMELMGFFRWRGWRGLIATLAAGSGLTEGLGSADLRVLLTLGWALPRQERISKREFAKSQPTTAPASAPAAPKVAKLDSKRFDALAAADPDRDGDGLPDSKDRCPTKAEDRDGFRDADGCPDLDNDRDGIPDVSDKCPLKPEVINGVKDDDGCPDKGRSRVVLSGRQLKLLDAKIFFRSGSDVLDKRSKPILREVAAALRTYWTIRKLRVEGHTDDRGDKEMNVDLSERRARRVRQFLIRHKVAAHRLLAKGFGPTKPIASNRRRKGRAKNRRVVFEIVEKADDTSPKPKRTKRASAKTERAKRASASVGRRPKRSGEAESLAPEAPSGSSARRHGGGGQ